MNSETPQTPAILAGLFRDVAWVRVTGKGCFQNSPQLREFANRVAEAGQDTMVVDLEECPHMDSTFMGTLTGIACQVFKDGKLHIVNVCERNAGLLKGLGIDQILDVDLNGSSWKEEREMVRDSITQEVECDPLNKVEHSELVLEAHETLCEANANNRAKFCNVIEFLKQDLADAKNGDSEAAQ
ncbi:MAG: STAS domain-containing protein [Verrucomicrobiota bacterium]